MSNTVNEIGELGRSFSDATVLMHYAIANKAGLTGADHKYLSLLLQEGALTAGELAKKTGLTTGAITGIIDRLEKRKLVKRVFDTGDRRKVLIVPNEKEAAKLFSKSSAILRTKMMATSAQFSAEEMAVVERYMKMAITTMKEFTEQINK